ncbi:MAG: rhomboid family intramembrane serine protease [Candidatus Hadarchaeaceae archaeon]
MTKANRLLVGFHPILKALLIFLVLNSGAFIVLSSWPFLLRWLWLSADRPWGILTSAFSHVDLDHFFSNAVGFTFAAALFVLVNLNKSEKARRRVSNRFLLLVFVAGIAANLLKYPFFLVRTGKPSYGASGIVYGALGIVFSCALHDLHSNIKFIARKRRRLAGRKKRRRGFRFDIGTINFFSSLFGISVVICTLFLVLFDISGFLNVAPDVDVFAHGIGFLIGLILFSGFQILR